MFHAGSKLPSRRPDYRLLLPILAALFAGGCSTTGDPGVAEEPIRHNILGTALLGQTNWAEAEVEFRRALESRPDDPLLLTNTAIAVYQRQRPEEATALLKQAVAADPGYAAAHFNLGLIDSRAGEFASAAAHFQTVVTLDPDELFTRYYLGTALARVGREDEAVAALRAALERDPAHVSALYALGRLLLQRGEQEEGLQFINRSQEIRARSGLDGAVGGEYAEQGPFSRAADYPGGSLQAPAAIPVSFEAGAPATLASVPRDLPWTLLTVGQDAAPLFVVGQGADVVQPFPPASTLATTLVEDATIAALAAGDTDDDGRTDIAALLLVGGQRLMPALFSQAEDGSFTHPATAASFSGDSSVSVPAGGGQDLVFVDRDHDGDLDLFWCWSGSGGGCSVATNDGAGNYEVKRSTDHGFAFDTTGSGRVIVAFSDVDNDRDIDLLAAGPGGLHVYTNQRDGSFDEISNDAGLGQTDAVALAVADLNKDGWMDLLVGGDAPRLLLNQRGRFAPPAPFGDVPTPAAGELVVIDFDNDGFLDVATSGGVLHNRGAGQWEGRADLFDSGLTPLAALDADLDGDVDLVVADDDGVRLLSNVGGNANRWFVLQSRGVGDNHFGIGSKIEVLAGALRQKFEITRPLPVHAGLGWRTRVEAVRYLWPTGVLQDEVDLPADGTTVVTELDRKGTSCPLLYAFQDGRWRFVTDFLGGSAIGYQQAPGVFGIPDTDEYVRIEGGLSEDEHGELRLRLNNQLEEVIWFDQIELLAVDHPEGTRIYPNERLMPRPPYPAFQLFAGNDIRPIVSAFSVDDGRDLTAALSQADRDYIDNFRLLRPKGYAELHTIEMDLGPFPEDRRVALLLDGWIDYADSTANVAAAQAGLTLVPPRLHIADGGGGWRDMTEGVMGFPAGLPKTMLVDLTGLFASSDHRLRIETSMRIYWDRARLMVGGEETPLRVVRLGPLRADLDFGGFPRPTSPDGRPPFGYDPENVDPTHPWKAHVGLYTGYGEVSDLLREIDDHFVTTRNGDQLELRFASPGPPDPGMVRTYLLFADGFGKDMDPNSASANTVGPIPFHGMPAYPYSTGATVGWVELPQGPAPRRVLPSSDGWPGALPLGRHLVER